MFERFFQWALRHGSRILFWMATAILLGTAWQGVAIIASHADVRATTYAGRVFEALAGSWEVLPVLVGGLMNAALPFFCALIIQRLDHWMLKGRLAVASIPAVPAGWIYRNGARLLLALSLLYFLSATLSFVDLVRQATSLGQAVFFQGTWIGPLWSGSLLLFASQALDRLDRWLANLRATCSD